MPRKPATAQVDALQEIQNRAFVLFGRFGYEGVSIGDIAKATKLSKGALYWHFDGKDALYLDCLKRLHSIFNETIFNPMQAQEDPLDAIVAMFAGLVALVADPRVEQGVAGYWLVPSRPEIDDLERAQRAFEKRSTEVIQSVLRRGADQGRFDFGGDLEDMSRAIMSIVEAIVLPLRHQSQEEVRANLGVLARTLFRAYAGSDDLKALVERL